MRPVTLRDLLRGTPAALDDLTAALRTLRAFRNGQTSIRAGVTLWQKRHGYPPTGNLDQRQLDQLLGEAAARRDPTTPED